MTSNHWADDLTICKSCKAAYKSPATHFGYPKLNDGTNSPHPWPLCETHAWPTAFIAGWNPVEITNEENK